MGKEYFDVLDEKGNKTGVIKLRNEVHRDGDWHRAVHIWILNPAGEVLLQRRCPHKDSYPNMLDISSAGHLVAGDDSLDGAIRELKEELDLDVQPSQLRFVTTVQERMRSGCDFVNNEFGDVYALITDKTVAQMRYQESEISEIFFVPYKDFKQMVASRQPDLIMHTEEFQALFDLFDPAFDPQ